EWNNQPHWFRRAPDGHFESPGAWDVVWEDLVEFDQRHPELWEYFAEVFLTWCRRGVDGFRCDAGYKVPTHVWQYITARVRQEFPDTVFLLEGLGGSWEATDALLTEGGMQWAYSELFQNHGSHALRTYLEHHLRTSARSGTLVHYSETHDNARLAARGLPVDAPLTAEGRRWSLHRNQLSALTSIGGGFGFTCGVEWCATEQVNVHSSRGLNWGHPGNLVPELARLNQLLADHPCFFADARVERLDPAGGEALLLRRRSADGRDSCLVVINPDFDAPASLVLAADLWREAGEPRHDLASGTELPAEALHPEPADGRIRLTLAPGAVRCLAPTPGPVGLGGDAYRQARARADWALAAYGAVRDLPDIPATPWEQLAAAVERDPAAFLAQTLPGAGAYPAVIRWEEADARKVTVVPPGHWLLVRDAHRFRATLRPGGDAPPRHAESIPVRGGQVAALAPRADGPDGPARLEIERYAGSPPGLGGDLLLLPSAPAIRPPDLRPTFHGPVALLTNGRGGMTRMAADLGRMTSKYDCLLGANLHPRVPVDRHVLAKRLRAWLNADGFITPLDAGNLVSFEPGPPAHWRFVANAGDGRSVEVHLVATLLDGANTLVLRFSRTNGRRTVVGRPLPPDCDVRLVLRVDLEDRGFHHETKRTNGADHHFESHTRPLALEHLHPGTPPAPDSHRLGFEFTPAPDRALRVYARAGVYHRQPEWCQNLAHPVEATRGMEAAGDAWSPGWFDIPLPPGAEADLVVTAEPSDPAPHAVAEAVSA
ncbi:MAG: glycogen debranching enzyme N-terminal domain-containing protein, partial [Verrucomicrobiota bacterium]